VANSTDNHSPRNLDRTYPRFGLILVHTIFVAVDRAKRTGPPT